MYNLFLDDERNVANVTWIALPRTGQWRVVRDFNQFCMCIVSYGLPDFVTFDHDLADEHYGAMLRDVELNRNGHQHEVDYGAEKTGYDCAKWLVDYCAKNGLKFPEYTVHSMNPIGRDRIIGYIENAKKHLGI